MKNQEITKEFKDYLYVEDHPLQKAEWFENGEIELSRELLDEFADCKREKVEIKEKKPRGRPRLYPKKMLQKIIYDENEDQEGKHENFLRKRGRPRKYVENNLRDISNIDLVKKEEISNSEFDIGKSIANIGPSFAAEIYTDYPEKVIEVKYLDDIKCFLIKWNSRSDGISPENSVVPSAMIKENFKKFYDELNYTYKFN